MSHRRSSLLFVLGAILLALPVVASAQTSRLEGMTLQGDYTKDYTAIYGWPSSLTGVGNMVYGEFGVVPGFFSGPATNDRAVGAVLSNLWDGRYGTWAIHLREETPALGQGDNIGQSNPGGLGGDPNTNTNESFDIMWAKKFGTSSFGLRVNRSFFKSEDEVPGVTTTLKFDAPFAAATGTDENLARNIMGYSAGLGFELNPETSVELALMYQSRTFENSVSAPVAKYEDDGPTTYLVGARAMWKWKPDVMVVPVFKWYSFDLSTKTTAGAATTSLDNSLKGWQIGAAGNWTIGSNDLFVLGASFAQNKLDQQADVFGLNAPGGPLFGAGFTDTLEVTESLTPMVTAALETHTNSWLTLRFGATKGMFTSLKVKNKGVGSHNLTVNSSPFAMNLGAGVKLGTLQLDAILNQFFPHTLGGMFSNIAFISFPKVTATYSF